MDVFEKIERALESDKTNNILRFGGYYFQSKIKQPSQQGMIIIATNNIGKKFAIKFYRPTDMDPKILKEGEQRFVSEINILISLSHRNVVKVQSGGKALWIEKDNKWDVYEGFDKAELGTTGEVLYFIMDFIEGKDISSIFPELGKKDGNWLEPKGIPLHERLRLFEDMICQIVDGIGYYQSKNITHKDIKPDNIRFSTEDSTFIIVDFGFARHITSPQDDSTIIRTEFIDLPSIRVRNYESNDLAQFSLVLLRILQSFKGEYDENRYWGIESILDRATNPQLDQRYETPSEFYSAIKQYFLTIATWKFDLKLNEYLCSNRFGRLSSKVRIPVSGSILLSEEVRRIVDTPEFQRLRGVRQLGPTIFVFPGANHTRYEHSMGTYFLSLRYLERLLELSTFRELCEPVDETIKLILLSSLLHDIGHYPYSHWIEEIDQFSNGIKFPSHEKRAKEIIHSDNIRKLIVEEWELDPETLSNIIAGEHVKGKGVLINSIIDSVIDTDKIDYLVRDSIHCGVEYGKGIDVERLLDSLYMDQNNYKICLTEKGRSCLLSILTCRNVMYQEIYWHKTVRACDAMFKRFFYEYIKERIDDVETIKSYFASSDDYFIGELYRKAKSNEDLAQLIIPFAFKGRSLYKPAYIFYRATASEEMVDTKNFFTKVLDPQPYSNLVDLSDNLAEKLKQYIPSIKTLDIIIEKTPVELQHEVYKFDGFRIWNRRKKRFESPPSEINPLNQYLTNNMQAYIFCNPRYYDDLRKLAIENKLDNILGELL